MMTPCRRRRLLALLLFPTPTPPPPPFPLIFLPHPPLCVTATQSDLSTDNADDWTSSYSLLSQLFPR
ncbi:unnamed protein product [Linum trigynum]|uniref:Secreted protein n=1 Tax=Linum trigynum TaxID=586398 RepID=A0AAV2D6B8_9ROSI